MNRGAAAAATRTFRGRRASRRRYFASALRLPAARNHRRVELVDDVIDALALADQRHAIVGDGLHVRGVSGGQRRRVSVGVELVAEPSLLFADEPTSGLDSATALRLARTLSALAREKRVTVVSVVHSPSPALSPRRRPRQRRGDAAATTPDPSAAQVRPLRPPHSPGPRRHRVRGQAGPRARLLCGARPRRARRGEPGGRGARDSRGPERLHVARGGVARARRRRVARVGGRRSRRAAAAPSSEAQLRRGHSSSGVALRALQDAQPLGPALGLRHRGPRGRAGRGTLLRVLVPQASRGLVHDGAVPHVHRGAGVVVAVRRRARGAVPRSVAFGRRRGPDRVLFRRESGRAAAARAAGWRVPARVHTPAASKSLRLARDEARERTSSRDVFAGTTLSPRRARARWRSTWQSPRARSRPRGSATSLPSPSSTRRGRSSRRPRPC